MPSPLVGRWAVCMLVAALCAPALSAEKSAGVKGSSVAAKPGIKKAKRSVADLVAYVKRLGSEKRYDKIIMRDLGYAEDVTVKRLVYKGKEWSDKFERSVCFCERENELLLFSDNPENPEGRIDAWTFRADRSGKLVAAAHTSGIGDAMEQTPVSIDESVRKRFERELGLLLDKVSLLAKK